MLNIFSQTIKHIVFLDWSSFSMIKSLLLLHYCSSVLPLCLGFSIFLFTKNHLFFTVDSLRLLFIVS